MAANLTSLKDVEAFTFDIFGTTVDWRSSVVQELSLRAFRKLSSVHNGSSQNPTSEAHLEAMTDKHWADFAQEWRSSYIEFAANFNPDQDEWKSVDQHHQDSLEDLLKKWQLGGCYNDSEIESLSLVWHRLDPWADTRDGIKALRRTCTVAALSNGNTSLLRDLCDFGDFSFNHIYSAEDFKAYKPNPKTYLGAVNDMGLEPRQVAMVAAHLDDLKAAASCGLRTVYIERPGEEAWDPKGEQYRHAKEWVDLWISKEEQGVLKLAQSIQTLT